ncbi:uncharacterized protein LOC133480481 isoform X1 [Phyllopteryx taeniolatus]|uniref:uncharacterized protein LOC133480481 isoform X1 n=2 Tax=Phyllopteryx taeniolatus TaxID=161469 RepID=UPI002AD3B053|nr:uncharacterized protein LOC133480481 isoform X1 [Phyllopteryx taeniolatus]
MWPSKKYSNCLRGRSRSTRRNFLQRKRRRNGKANNDWTCSQASPSVTRSGSLLTAFWLTSQHKKLTLKKMQQMSLVSGDEVPSEGQGEPAEPHRVKEEEEDVWRSQNGEQLRGLKEVADVNAFTLTGGHEKKEVDEARSPQRRDLQSVKFGQHTTTEAYGDHCGGSQPDNFAPLQDMDDVASKSHRSDRTEDTLKTNKNSKDTEEDLLVFLRQRNISSELLSQMERDKIDSSVNLLMSDEELQKYIPHYGDRIAVVAFCRNPTSEARRKVIVDRRPTPPSCSRGSYLFGNGNGKRAKRRLELGWMNFDWKEKRFKQVRSGRGGGTKSLCIEKSKTVQEIQMMAEGIFFPDGQLSDYQTRITDFAEHQLDSASTLEEVYEITQARILRLYLCTKRRGQEAIQWNLDLGT